MQRILQPGEIEALDRIDFPRVRLPQPASLFAERAARWRQLADGHPIADYLRFMARLADAQARAAAQVQTPAVDSALLERAVTHAMPALPAADHLDAGWQAVLQELLGDLLGEPQGQAELPEPLALLARELRDTPPDTLDAFALQVLQGLQDGQAPSTLQARSAQPLLVAALQVLYADRASRLPAQQLPVVSPATVCPHCGTPPVASVLRIGGQAGGHRYLHCGLCATEWHMVRVKCSHCESTKGIKYQALQGQPEVVVAETCDHCFSYRKLVNQEKDPHAEPLADDLASLMLDLLMGDTDYVRASANPLLALPGESDGAGA